MGLFHFGSAGGLGIALICVLVSLSTPGWVYVTILPTAAGVTPDYSESSIACGLFYSEPQLNNFGGNMDYGNGLYITSTQTSVCICCMCVSLGFLVVGIMANSFTGNFIRERRLAKVGGIMGLVAGIFLLIGMSVFTGLALSTPFYRDFVFGDHDFVTLSWGYSFAFGWTATAISLLSGVVGLLGNSDGMSK